MLHKIMPLALLPLMLLTTQAEARRLQWWEMIDTSAPYGAYDDQEGDDFMLPDEDANLVYGPDPYTQYDRLPERPRAKPLTRLERMRRDLRRAKIQGQASPRPVVAFPVKPSKPKPALNGTSCEKGAAIVASFGFEQVAPKTCSGPILAFSAKRSGKPFEVNVVAATGELSAVKKL